MKVHYFFIHDRMEYFYKLEIIALLEEVETSRLGVKRLNFTYLEQLKMFISKDNKYHNHSFVHDFAQNSYTGHWAHSRKELTEAMNKRDFKPISQINYCRFRKVALAIYQKQHLVDFSKYKGRQNYTIRQIIGD